MNGHFKEDKTLRNVCREIILKAPPKSLFSKGAHKKKSLSNSESLNKHPTVTIYSGHVYIFIAAVNCTISTIYVYILEVNRDKTWQMFGKTLNSFRKVKNIQNCHY